MTGFKKVSETKNDDNWDSRQRLVDGWDAEAIKNATLLIIGAGAIGNEVLKNCALLGFGNVIICDLDKIEVSNLTRTVLFSEADVGKEKAPLAAERFKQLCLEPTAGADSISGDIVYELGDGVFRKVDIVLGCLDNVETRMRVNQVCMRYDIPYIDAGIGSLGCTLQVMNGHKYGCYECFAPPYKYEDRFRMSCDITKKKAVNNKKMATVQCTSAIVAGWQVQEALKTICKMNPVYGVELHLQGTANIFNKFDMNIDENCPAHTLDARSNIIETPISNKSTLRSFLEYVSELGYDEMSVLDDKLRSLITTVRCPNCGVSKEIYQPAFKVFHSDYYCDDCLGNKGEEIFFNDLSDVSVCDYSLTKTDEKILDMTLDQLGIPAFHVITVLNSVTDEVAYVELTADYELVLPSHFKKHMKET